MENMVIDSNFWLNRKVLVTGHTGFKGGWLTIWLSMMGARVFGYSLPPVLKPNFYDEVNVDKFMSGSIFGDIRNLSSLVDVVSNFRPSVIFHLAAQPLVYDSYRKPVDTFSTNILGTVNLLEAVRLTDGVEAVVNVTTDKCYDNSESLWPYREIDRLGGYDPYSSSKACSELVTTAYRNSFLTNNGKYLATARAGNVIGGGDWSPDRLIPDFFRAYDASTPFLVRSPNSVRPWQHVLEPLCGYMNLAQQLVISGKKFADSWNFGPEQSDTKDVRWIVERLSIMLPRCIFQFDKNSQFHESEVLKLDISKSKYFLGWKPRWTIETALEKTVQWHNSWKAKIDMANFSLGQIEDYIKC